MWPSQVTRIQEKDLGEEDKPIRVASPSALLTTPLSKRNVGQTLILSIRGAG